VTAVLLLLLAAPDARAAAAIDALQHDDSSKVRTQAAIILGQRGAHEAVPALRQAATSDDSAAVRLAAIGALTKLHARAARPTLVNVRDTDPEDAVRAAARRALDSLGAAALHVEEPTGTQALREPMKAALTARLRAMGFAVEDGGEIKLKPKVQVDVTGGGGKTVISVKTSVVVVDADGHLDMIDGSARATMAGTLPDDRVVATASKVVDAALGPVCQDLAGKLGRR
jgi:hypothetical protein